MPFETSAKLLALTLAILQVVTLVASLRSGISRFSCLGSFLCPSVILGFCVSGMRPIHWSNLRRVEVAFLIFHVASILVSLLFIRPSGRPPALFLAVWLANSVLCTMLLYLAFFFRLF